MNPTKIFNSTGIRKLYNDLKLKNKLLLEENKYLRNRTTEQLEKQNELLQDALDNCGAG